MSERLSLCPAKRDGCGLRGAALPHATWSSWPPGSSCLGCRTRWPRTSKPITLHAPTQETQLSEWHVCHSLQVQ